MGRLDAAQAQRTDAERIAHRQHAVAGDLRGDRIRAAHAAVHAGHRGEDDLGIERSAVAGALQLVGQHVQQHLGIRMRIDVAAIAPEHLLAQLLPVGQVAVMREDDAVRRIDVERLGLFLAGGRACGRVAHLADARRARQAAHIARAEHVAHQAVGLVHVESAAVGGRDARGVLTAVLQQQQAVVNQLIDGRGRHHTDDTAHAKLPGKALIRRALRAADGRPGAKSSCRAYARPQVLTYLAISGGNQGRSDSIAAIT